jgi:hypothetical protein
LKVGLGAIDSFSPPKGIWEWSRLPLTKRDVVLKNLFSQLSGFLAGVLVGLSACWMRGDRSNLYTYLILLSAIGQTLACLFAVRHKFFALFLAVFAPCFVGSLPVAEEWIVLQLTLTGALLSTNYMHDERVSVAADCAWMGSNQVGPRPCEGILRKGNEFLGYAGKRPYTLGIR